MLARVWSVLGDATESAPATMQLSMASRACTRQ
jgi:hypothetical protein